MGRRNMVALAKKCAAISDETMKRRAFNLLKYAGLLEGMKIGGLLMPKIQEKIELSFPNGIDAAIEQAWLGVEKIIALAMVKS